MALWITPYTCHFTDNVLVLFDWLKSFTFQAISNATVSVDTFFLLRYIKGNKKLSKKSALHLLFLELMLENTCITWINSQCFFALALQFFAKWKLFVFPVHDCHWPCHTVVQWVTAELPAAAGDEADRGAGHPLGQVLLPPLLEVLTFTFYTYRSQSAVSLGHKAQRSVP